MNRVPTEPVGSSASSSFSSHRLLENNIGIGIVPTRGPLYFAFFFFVLTPIAWLLTKDLRIDTGLKIAAVLFPLFAGGGPFILWLVLNKFGARIFFNLQSGTLQFNGFRFKHIGPIPIGDVIAIQSCYAGFELGTRRGSSSYQKYELNLVLRSGEKIKRINLLCHSVQDKITTQGKAIAKRIRVPFLQGNQEEM